MFKLNLKIDIKRVQNHGMQYQKKSHSFIYFFTLALLSISEKENIQESNPPYLICFENIYNNARV